MIVGVIEHSKFDNELVTGVGFDFTEMKSQYVMLSDISKESFMDSLTEANENHYPYLIINTCGDCKINKCKELLSSVKDAVLENNIPIFIENGFCGSDAVGYNCNDFSEIDGLREVIDFGNDLCGEEIFGICINVGYANLLAKEIKAYIEKCGSNLKLVHINDNAGFKNEKQMPYTFTRGRGDYTTTDWTRVIAALIKVGFDGYMVFDTEGLFNRIPEMIIDRILGMLVCIAQHWLLIITFEDLLNCGRKIILFGAGRMASNYMYIWGDKYKPCFIVDNNDKRWGTLHRGIEVKSPDSIYDIPEDERLVLLCNMNYEAIGLQLRKMGVPYVKYDDNYYDFVLQ